MPSKKISQLTAATTPLTGTEELPIVQGGITKKTTAQDIADLGGGGASYTSYVAKLYFDGTPNVVFENTTGLTFTWISVGEGAGLQVNLGNVNIDKYFILLTNSSNYGLPRYCSYEFTGTTTKYLGIETSDAEDSITSCMVEIRIYP